VPYRRPWCKFHVMVDDDPRTGGVQNLLSIPASIWRGIIPQDGTTYHHAALIGLLTIVVLVVWKLLMPKKLKFIPAPLAAVVIAVLVARLLSLDILFIEPKSLIEGIRVPSLETWEKVQANGMGIVELLLAGLSFGLVASAETLLAVTATDRMHQGPRAKYDRELFAQGVGNLLCGFATALPMTGVIVRSTANIDAGARTRLSAILHGVWILLFVSILPHWLEAVPKACLGAILVYTGYKLVNPRSAMSLWAYGKGEFFIYLTTLVMIVVTDLLTGVLVGIGLSALKLLYTFSHLRIDVRHDRTNNRCNLKLVGAVTFLRLPKLADAIEHLPPNCELNVDVSRVDYIDHACLDLLMNWQQQHEDQGGKLIIDWGQLHAKFFNGPGRSVTQNGPISPQDVKKLKALQH
jgi:MFS superfamily sulfate permease-like transporter